MPKDTRPLSLEDPSNAKANTFVDHYAEALAHLKARWQDEREYEDFGSYVRYARECCQDEGVEFVDFSKGFVLVFRVDGHTYEAKINLGSVTLVRRRDVKPSTPSKSASKRDGGLPKASGGGKVRSSSNEAGRDAREERRADMTDSKKALMGKTKSELVALLNKENGTNYAEATFNSKGKVVAKIVAAREARLVKDEQWKTVREAAEDLMMRNDPALSYSEIISRIRAAFPKAKTSLACLRWYATHMRSQDLILPDRPRSVSEKD
jgi:hypothetical protein